MPESLSHRINCFMKVVAAQREDTKFKMSEELVGWICSLLADTRFLLTPLELQLSFLEFLHALHANPRHYHGLSVSIAEAVQKLFAIYLNNSKHYNINLKQVLKIYDMLYLLYWCSSVSIDKQEGFNSNVVVPFSNYLAQSFSPARPYEVHIKLVGKKPITLCYLAQFCYEGNGNSLATVAEGFLRNLSDNYAEHYILHLYAWMYQDDKYIDKIKDMGITVRCFDLAEYSEDRLAELRNFILSDGIDVVITDMNSAIPTYLFESRIAPIQIFYQLGMPFWQLKNLDAVFLGWDIPPATLGFKNEDCYLISAPWMNGNINHVIDTINVQNERNRFPKDKRIIGFYGRLVKITCDYLEIIVIILSSCTDTIAVMGGSGDATMIRKFIKDRRLEERLFVVDEFVDGSLWGHFIDIFLDTFPLMGGYSCREVMAKGKPVVHMKSKEMVNLNDERDPQLLAYTVDEYAIKAIRLLSDPVEYQMACNRSLQISRIQQQSGSKIFASMVHSTIDDIISKKQALLA